MRQKPHRLHKHPDYRDWHLFDQAVEEYDHWLIPRLEKILETPDVAEEMIKQLLLEVKG